MFINKGQGYAQGSDVLILDISNNDEYIWTTSFEPLPPPSPSPVPSSSIPVSSSTITVQPNTQSNNPGVMVGAAIGSLIGGILLATGSSFFYKRYKNNKKQNQAIPTPGNNYPQAFLGERTTYYQGHQATPTPGHNYQGVSQIPRERTTYQGQQATPPSQIQPIHNHGQEAAPNIQDTRLSVLNNDPSSLQNYILQAVREEVDNRMAKNY